MLEHLRGALGRLPLGGARLGRAPPSAGPAEGAEQHVGERAFIARQHDDRQDQAELPSSAAAIHQQLVVEHEPMPPPRAPRTRLSSEMTGRHVGAGRSG
jgi:hypothetical protein